MPVSSALLPHLLIIQLLIVASLQAQRAKDLPDRNVFKQAYNQQLDGSLTPESDCSNGIDDNGNGLADSNDSHCYFYFDSLDYDGCEPTSILWAISSLGIHWINLATNEERIVSPSAGDFFDITWSPNGKLYAVDYTGRIYEIDPLSWSYTPVAFVDGAIAMTADANGMLYLATVKGLTGDEACNLVKFDPVTHETETIVRLSNYGLFASGDCCFLDGFLYVTCKGYLAKVDVNAKTVEKLPLGYTYLDDSYGITSLGDGYLYLTDNGPNIYRLDPATMDARLVKRFSHEEMITTGFASYAEVCHAPCSKPIVSLGVDTVVCSNSVLLLNPQVDRTASSFLWSNGGTQKTATIDSPGTYWLKVDNICDTNTDTIVVSSASEPLVALQSDTLICTYSSIVLRNFQMTQERDRFLWSDNSDQATFTVTAAGTYWLRMSNVCGSVADTVHILPKIDSCECFMYIPNAFSPNSDKTNDVFQLASNCMVKGTIQIFNRWGQSVYRSESLDVGWNGEWAGKLQPEGVYVYTIRFSYLNHPGTFSRKGTITLVR